MDNIKNAINQLGLFKFITCDGNTYLFRDTEDPRQMANFIEIIIDEPNKELIICGFGISNSRRGMGKKVVDTILNQLDNSWLVKIENNLNPSFWQHLNQKYYPNFTFISI
jgi:hypothetical protein